MGVVQSTAAAVSPTIQRAAAATSAAVFRTEQYKPLEEPKTVIDFEEKKSCFDKYKGLVAAVFLSVLTASLFLLRSGPLASATCSNVILILCEFIKFSVALIYGGTSSSRRSPVNVAVNLLSFWALKYTRLSAPS